MPISALETELVREDVERVCEETGEDYEILSKSTLRVDELVMSVGDGCNVSIHSDQNGECLLDGDVSDVRLFLRGYLAA